MGIRFDEVSIKISDTQVNNLQTCSINGIFIACSFSITESDNFVICCMPRFVNSETAIKF